MARLLRRPNGIEKAPCTACDGTGTIARVSGEWARRERHRAGLSLREVARRMGLSAPYLCDQELGRRPINESMWTRYLAALALGPEK